MSDNETILLAGPPAAGKSSTAGLLANIVGKRVVSADALWDRYAVRWGYSRQREVYLDSTAGVRAVFDYWRPFEALVLRALVRDFPGSVIDAGGGCLVQNSARERSLVAEALLQVDHRFLLMPEPDDVARSQSVIASRLAARAKRDGFLASWLLRGGAALVDDLVTAMFPPPSRFTVVPSPDDIRVEGTTTLILEQLGVVLGHTELRDAPADAVRKQ